MSERVKKLADTSSILHSSIPPWTTMFPNGNLSDCILTYVLAFRHGGGGGDDEEGGGGGKKEGIEDEKELNPGEKKKM